MFALSFCVFAFNPRRCDNRMRLKAEAPYQVLSLLRQACFGCKLHSQYPSVVPSPLLGHHSGESTRNKPSAIPDGGLPGYCVEGMQIGV